MKDFEIGSSLEHISKFSKRQYKDMVKKACRSVEYKKLCEARLKLSKGSEIHYASLDLQPYLKASNKLTPETMKRILKIRIRDIPLKCNSPKMFSDKRCLAAPQCNGDDSNSHIFSCSFLESEYQLSSSVIRYEEIFSDNIQQQELVANIFFKRLEKRKQFEPRSPVGSHDPRMAKVISLGIREARKKTRKRLKSKISFN